MNENIERTIQFKWHDPKPSYDVIIIGGGGHGLATAYYLATRHGITNVAVLEKKYDIPFRLFLILHVPLII